MRIATSQFKGFIHISCQRWHWLRFISVAYGHPVHHSLLPAVVFPTPRSRVKVSISASVNRHTNARCHDELITSSSMIHLGMAERSWDSVVEVFPHLVPSDPDFTAFEGFISTPACKQHTALWLKVTNPASSPRTVPPTLQLSDGIKQLLKGQEQQLQHRLESCHDLHSYLLDLRNLLEISAAAQSHQRPLPLDLYQQLHREIDEVGWSCIRAIDHERSTIELDLRDAAGRAHTVRVQVQGGSLDVAPLTAADLPQPLLLQWGPARGLGSIVEQYQRAFAEWHDFWCCVEDLDTHTWVLEPQSPRRGDCSRRIVLRQHCFLLMKLDPLHPRAPPECSFLGAAATVEPLESSFYSSLGKWDEGRLPRENIEELLGLALPTRSEEGEGEDMSVECAICYAFYLPDPNNSDHPGDTPDTSCPHPPCSRGFHHKCLAEWLAALDTTTRVLSTLFGKCPYCESAISVNALV